MYITTALRGQWTWKKCFFIINYRPDLRDIVTLKERETREREKRRGTDIEREEEEARSVCFPESDAVWYSLPKTDSDLSCQYHNVTDDAVGKCFLSVLSISVCRPKHPTHSWSLCA